MDGITMSNNADNNKNNNNTNNIGAIHCKVFYNGQFRRFQVIPTSVSQGTYDFNALHAHLKALLGLDSDFYLKYQDNESDYITVSSDEELACAVSILKPGDILRLFVTPQTDPTTDVSTIMATSPHCPAIPGPFPPPPSVTPYEYWGGCGRGRGFHRGPQHLSDHHPYHHPHHHRGGRGGHHGAEGGRHHPYMDKSQWIQFKREKMMTKLAIMESLLACQEGEGREKLERKIEKIKGKIECINNKEQGKKCKDKKKGNGEQPPLWSMIKSKKAELRQAEVDGNAEMVDKLSAELQALKLEKREHRKEKK